MFGTPEDILYLIDPVIFVIQMALLVGLLLLAIFYPYHAEETGPSGARDRQRGRLLPPGG